jgi:hypothetical protein
LKKGKAMSEDRLAALEKANAELRAELDALKPKAEPKPFKVQPMPRIDWTEGMSMDRATMASFAAAVPDSLVRSVVGDNVRSAPVTKPEEPKVIPSQKGWIEPAPLGPPAGQRWVEAQLDVAAALDKRELEKKLGHKPE